MSNNPDPNDPNMDIGDLEGDMDPFADPAASTGGSEGADPFNFSEGEGAPPPPKPKASAPKAPSARKRKSPAPPAPASSAVGSEAGTAGLAADVPVQVVAVMGKKTITVKDLVSLKKGQVVELNRFPNEAVDLVANGKLMAKGELVEIEGKLGIRIIKIFE